MTTATPGVPVINLTGKTNALTKPGSQVHSLVTNYDSINKLLYTATGLTSPVLDWATAQALFESGGGSSAVARANNNYTGIMFINKPYQQATKGTARPASEGGNYAKYANPQAWAKDFVRILSINGPMGAPIKATSLGDYVARLKANKYFASSPTAYQAGLATILNANKQMAPVVQRVDHQMVDDAAAHSGTPFKMPWWGWLVGGLVAYKVFID